MECKITSVKTKPEHFVLPTGIVISKQNMEMAIFNASAKLDHHAYHNDGTFDSTNQASLELIGLIKQVCTDGTSDAQRVGLLNLIEQCRKEILPEDVRKNFKTAVKEIFTQYPLACLLLAKEELNAISEVDALLGQELETKFNITTEAAESAAKAIEKPSITNNNSKTQTEYHRGFSSSSNITDANHKGMLYLLNDKLSY